MRFAHLRALVALAPLCVSATARAQFIDPCGEATCIEVKAAYVSLYPAPSCGGGEYGVVADLVTGMPSTYDGRGVLGGAGVSLTPSTQQSYFDASCHMSAGTAVCARVYRCPDGYKQCGRLCAPAAGCCSAAECPPPPPHATTTCDSSCGYACDDDYKRCAEACIAQTSCCGDVDCGGDPCLLDAHCIGGACVGTQKTCTPSATCRVAECNAGTGACDEGVAAAGASCEPESPCVQDPRCDSTGACVGDLVPDGTPCSLSCGEGSACVGGACVCLHTSGPNAPLDLAAPGDGGTRCDGDCGGCSCTAVPGHTRGVPMLAWIALTLGLVGRVRARRRRNLV